ncbi:hypothetical protein [Mucilaginibacter boryungensis]|uniref:hypothetical protein n=1 Tax=Mucilaginibacter boryungensis TaxID=768480 RepID=UPI0036295697
MGMMILGVLVLLTGIALRYSYGRARYNKRFEPVKVISYERKIMSNTGQELKFFLYIACIIVGLILLTMGYIIHKDPNANDLKRPTTSAVIKSH